MNEIMPTFKVINWNFNHDTIEYYDVFPYFVRCWEKEIERGFFIYTNHDDKTRKPETFEEFKYFIWSSAKHRFWSRCEYEVIVTGWPVQKNHVKIDVFQQIDANLDVITNLFIDYIKSER